MWHHLYTHAINSSQTITIHIYCTFTTHHSAPFLPALPGQAQACHCHRSIINAVVIVMWRGNGDNVSVSARQRNVSHYDFHRVCGCDATYSLTELDYYVRRSTTNGMPEIKNLLFYALSAMRLICDASTRHLVREWTAQLKIVSFFPSLRLFASHTKTHSPHHTTT